MYELKVDGMSCGHCVKAVTGAVRGIDAAAAVDVNLAGKTVRVKSAASLNAITAAITEAGYQVLESGPV